jgi:outer membrane cobalamin receptor
MGTNQMGVFYDGIQIGNAQNGQIDLGRFSLDNIESISIYNGQKSSMLQSAKDYGSAGTIYIQTLYPKFADNKHFNLTARFKAGAFGIINPSFLYQQKFSDKISLSLSSEFMKAHGRYKFHFQSFATSKDTIAERKNADITALRTEAALFGLFDDGNWKMQIYNFNSERGLPGYIGRNIFEHNERQQDNNFFVQGTFKKYFHNYSLLFNVKYANDYTRYMNTHYRQNETYLSLANSYRPFKIWEIALAADFQFNNLFSNRTDFSVPTRYTLLTALSSSVKLQHTKFQASMLGTFVKDEVKKGVSQKYKAEFTPAVMASFSPFKAFPLDFRAFCKRIFRMPTFNDLYYTIATTSYLKPEFVQQYDIGAEYILFKNKRQNKKDGFRVQNFNFSVDFYYNSVKNKITAVPTSNPFRWQMMNFGKVKIFGADFSTDIELLLRKNMILNILANYSLQDARNVTDVKDLYYGHLIPYSPQHCATFAVNFQYKKFRLNYCFIYTGERYSARNNEPSTYIRPFQTHDVSGGYEITFPKFKILEKMIINLDINNIFNQHYEVVLNYPMPGTNFKIGATLEF